MTLSLKSSITDTYSACIVSMAKAFSLSCPIEFLNHVFILFNVEKQRSASALETGVVSVIPKSLNTSENVSTRLFSMKNACKLITDLHGVNMPLLYTICSSVRNLSFINIE